HRAEVAAPNPLPDGRTLQPTKKNLRGTGIRDCALAQATFDLRVARWRATTARCAAEAGATEDVVSAIAFLREPRTTMGGVNLVAGFRPELWGESLPEDAPG